MEAFEPAVAAQALPSRTLAYSEPAVAATAAVDEPVSLGEYARQLRAFPVEHLSVQPLDAGTAEIAVATHEPEISLGEVAREGRAARVAQLDLQTPEVAGPETAVAAQQPDDGISLGEYARQLQLRRGVSEPMAIVPRGPEAQSSRDAGQPVSLGEYARRLRAVRSVPAYESASITPLPPRTEVKVPQPEISLGEYARQLRMRRAAEEYMRLLAQDDPAIAAVLTADAKTPIRYHEIRSTVAAPSPRQRRVAATVVAPRKKNSTLDAPGHMAVTVRRGDSLWKLARNYMGSGARWQSIAFLKNHPGSPDLIRVGEVVLIPVSDSQRARGAEFASRFPGRRLR
jgi:nucleoid-associated protein YgaU